MAAPNERLSWLKAAQHWDWDRIRRDYLRHYRRLPADLFPGPPPNVPPQQRRVPDMEERLRTANLDNLYFTYRVLSVLNHGTLWSAQLSPPPLQPFKLQLQYLMLAGPLVLGLVKMVAFLYRLRLDDEIRSARRGYEELSLRLGRVPKDPDAT